MYNWYVVGHVTIYLDNATECRAKAACLTG